MNALDRGFVSSGFSHCPLLNLSCDWFNYMECVGNKGMEVRIFFTFVEKWRRLFTCNSETVA